MELLYLTTALIRVNDYYSLSRDEVQVGAYSDSSAFHRPPCAFSSLAARAQFTPITAAGVRAVISRIVRR